jgi:hypothetical protein
MKEIKSGILDDFLAKNNQGCHQQFMGTVFQDICGRIFVDSPYSRYLNDPRCFDKQKGATNVKVPQIKGDIG